MEGSLLGWLTLLVSFLTLCGIVPGIARIYTRLGEIDVKIGKVETSTNGHAKAFGECRTHSEAAHGELFRRVGGLEQNVATLSERVKG